MLKWPPGSISWFCHYRQISNISRTIVGYEIVDHSECSWSIACRRCSNYIFIFDLTHGFNRFHKDNCKTRQETFKFWDWVHLILEIWWYVCYAVPFVALNHNKTQQSTNSAYNSSDELFVTHCCPRCSMLQNSHAHTRYFLVVRY